MHNDQACFDVIVENVFEFGFFSLDAGRTIHIGRWNKIKQVSGERGSFLSRVAQEVLEGSCID